MEKIKSIKAVLTDYDNFIIDQWGVMHDGTFGYEHAFDAINFLKNSNKNLFIISNSSKRSKSFDELFLGADIFVEKELPNGMSFGISYVPVDVELGSGKRTDSSTGADVASEADTGTRSASADLSDLITVYGNFPIGDEGVYGLAGMHFVTVSTSETLPNSSYGDDDIFGGLIGLGMKSGNKKLEFFYSDFEDISISSSGGDNSNKVTADADALTLRLSVGF